MEQWYSDFMLQRQAYGLKKPACDFVKCFLNWCRREYPGEHYLTQTMIDAWCTKRESENANSHSNRVQSVNHFINYICERDGGPYNMVSCRGSHSAPEPVLATAEEIDNFFRAVDEMPYVTESARTNRIRSTYLSALECPALFRMLYSTGIRVNEIRWLRREDVDLENGIVYIHRAKGYHERMVVLHPTMTALLRRYDSLVRKALPESDAFFPTIKGTSHNQSWLNVRFKQLWYKYNPKPAEGEREVVAYVFRHNYAIENIMSWDQNGYNADKKMVALSKSMGHRQIESTQYYYHLVPRFADLLDTTEGASVNEIIPKVDTL